MVNDSEISSITAPLKVIVAEDDAIQRAYLCTLIQALGYDVIPAEDGEEALERVVATGAEILISDLEMPKLDGIALTRKIRAMELDTYIHIFMITGSDEVAIRNEALSAGVDDFLTKGGSPAMLKARIHTATRLIGHAGELAERTRVLKASNDHIKEDLRAAATAQRQLLPDVQKDILGFSIASAFVPSAIVSGDMFSCFALDEQRLGFYAVDVSGHGVHAALLSVAIGHLITPEFFRTKALGKNETPNPAALVADLNARFSIADNDDYFTMFCGVIDIQTGRLDYCQAGYPSPFYVTQSGATEPVGHGGFPVGMLASATFESHAHTLAYGSSLIVSSDAACEAVSRSSQPFGTARVSKIAQTTPDVGIENIPECLVKSLNDWRDGEPLEDDLTVLTLTRKKPHDTHNHV